MGRKTKIFWIVLLYLAQGFPFGVITFQLPFYFRKHGFSLELIGFLTLLTIPWSLKVLWAPIVDRFGERKHWIAAMQGVMGLLFLSLTRADPASPPGWLFAVLLLLPFASATADIAIDAYTIEILNEDEMPSGNAARMISWKVAYVIATGAIGTVATLFSWNTAFIFSGVFLFSLVPLTLLAPPSRAALAPTPVEKPSSLLSSRFWFEGYRTLIDRPGILWVLLFVLTYKLGTATSGSMILPFWADRNYTPAETGIVSGAVGALESIGAPLAAAWFISRVRLFNALWIFAILQILPGLVYGAVAYWDLGRPAMYAASLSQSFDLSLANLAFTSFLMMICDKKYAATQYAFLSCVFALTRSLAGWMGGITAGAWGYAPFFLFTFFLGFVAFAFLPWVKRWIESTKVSP